MIRYIRPMFESLYVINRFHREAKITTHLTPGEKLKIKALASKIVGDTFVEIGSYLGASSCFISLGIKKHNKNAKLFCIDTWANDAMSEGKRDTFSEFMENTKPFKDIIVPVKGRSVDKVKEFNKKIDFLFFDGDHSYEGIKQDLECWIPKLNSNSLVIMHDTGWAEGVKRALNEEILPKCKKTGSLPNMTWAWM